MRWETVVVVAVVPIVFAALSRAGALGAVSPGELRYARTFRWFSVGMAIVPPLALLALFTFQRRPLRPDERFAVVAVVLFFPVLMAPVLLELLRVRHRFDDEGIAFRSPWTRHRHVAWSDVASLRWRKMAKWLDLRTHAGVTVHLSPWLSGLAPFARLALGRIAPAVLASSPDGRAALQVMAAGAAGALMTSPLPPERLLETLPAANGHPLA